MESTVAVPRPIEGIKPEETHGEPNNVLWFKYLLGFVPPEKLERGVYTEIHYGPDSQVYITPDVVGMETHWASAAGSHSMWESKHRFFATAPDGTALDNELIREVPFSTETVIAKGVLVRRGKDLILRIENTQIDNFLLLTSLHSGDPRGDLLVALSGTLPAIGIAALTSREGKKTEETKVEIREGVKLFYDVCSKSYPTSGETAPSGCYSGIVSKIEYTPPRRVINWTTARNSAAITEKKTIYLDLDEGPTSTHDQLVGLMAKDVRKPKKMHGKERQTSRLTIAGQQFGVMGRYTLDLTNHRLVINLIIENEGEIEQSVDLREFEHAFFYTCAKTVLGQALEDSRMNPQDFKQFNLGLNTTLVRPVQASQAAESDIAHVLGNLFLGSPGLYSGNDNATPRAALAQSRLGRMIHQVLGQRQQMKPA